ncbi:MAG TPA: peptidylprolyl isomerase [Thermoplasmata archaeon]|jgi:peptidylprolyl isomerase|nr:peptidylprolyl isomerase [Thermoplasmata archaeon]
MTGKAQPGSKVKIRYRGTLADGEEFDSNLNGEPLEFQVGEGQVIDGFDKAVLGMAVGEEKTFTIPPDEAYGAHDGALIMDVPRSQLPEDGLFLGIGVRIRLQDGRTAEGIVTKIGEETVTLDFNHPLAGKPLTFAIKIVDVR